MGKQNTKEVNRGQGADADAKKSAELKEPADILSKLAGREITIRFRNKNEIEESPENAAINLLKSAVRELQHNRRLEWSRKHLLSWLDTLVVDCSYVAALDQTIVANHDIRQCAFFKNPSPFKEVGRRIVIAVARDLWQRALSKAEISNYLNLCKHAPLQPELQWLEDHVALQLDFPKFRAGLIESAVANEALTRLNYVVHLHQCGANPALRQG